MWDRESLSSLLTLLAGVAAAVTLIALAPDLPPEAAPDVRARRLPEVAQGCPPGLTLPVPPQPVCATAR